MRNMQARKEARSGPFEWSAGMLWMVLLWAWIKPIALMSDWTEPDMLVPLFGAIGFCVLLDMLRISPWKSVPLKALAAWLAVGWLFRNDGGHSSVGWDWLRRYGSLLSRDVHAVLTGSPGTVSGENRTLIFLAGWILLAGVVLSILVYKKRALWLVAATWLYLTGLQLWPGLDTTGEIIASGLAGTALLAVLQLERIRTVCPTALVRVKAAAGRPGSGGDAGRPAKEASGVSEDAVLRRWPSPAVIPPGLYAAVLAATLLFFAGALAGSGGHAGAVKPLGSDVWSELADRFASGRLFGGRDTEAAASFRPQGGVTGYGDDDSRLGGPLAVSDTPVFTARTPELTYWRGESKSFYDGKGWSKKAASVIADAGDPEAAALSAVQGAGMAARLSAGGAALQSAADSAPDPAGSGEMLERTGTSSGSTALVTQEIMYDGSRPLNMVFSGGAVEEILSLYTLEGKELPQSVLETDRESGFIGLKPGQGQLGYARLKVRLPGYDANALIAAQGPVPQAIEDAYLQLPDGLPERVRRLAADISAPGATPYAKALLIESYLQEHYRYSLTDVSVPEKGQDFVDAFLFGGKGGYCDYFSTSMAVMLRSVGVPARWVKGFSPGQTVSEEDGVRTVEVRGKNAHSWVEAYIPSAGWTAMDPTPGFSGFAGAESEAVPALLKTQALPKPEVKGGSLLPNLRQMGASIREGLLALGHYASSLAAGYGLLIAAAALVLAAVLYIVRSRGFLLVMLLLLRFRQRGNSPALVLKLLDKLWGRVFRQYGKPLPGETLREYALHRGDRTPDGGAALAELVRLYEASRFAGGTGGWVPRRQLVQLWRELFAAKHSGGKGGMPL